MQSNTLVHPLDEYNQTLVKNVHPSGLKNPHPAKNYNLVVIGAGTAGLVTAVAAATLGAKVALVERNLFGGDCLNYGCVPSKSIIHASRVNIAIHSARDYGAEIPPDVRVNFGIIMERMRRIRAKISTHDSLQRFASMGVDIFLGNGKFADRNTLTVDGASLSFKKAVITTGARPAVPPIEGLKEAGNLTNETVFSLTEKPNRLLVMGAGPIGSELAQAFCNLGVEVTIVDMFSQILSKEDPDAAQVIQKRFQSDGVKILLNTKTVRVETRGNEKHVTLERNGQSETRIVDEILVATGRSPNVNDLGLEAIGVEYDAKKGIQVNDFMQTTNPRIYAAGDCCVKYQFTHMADATARLVIQNALFFGRGKLSNLIVPWCTYTTPEVARVGLNETEAKQQGIDYDVYTRPFSEVDRAVIDGQDDGFVKIVTKKGSDRILGATIVAEHAGDMISEIVTAMNGKMSLKQIANVIHPYPPQAEAIKQVGDMFNRNRLKPWMKNMFNRWFAWRR